MTSEELEYLKSRPLVKRMTFDGVNDLYNHPTYGCYTIGDLIQKERSVVSTSKVVYPKEVEMSYEMGQMNERFIEKYGYSMF